MNQSKSTRYDSTRGKDSGRTLGEAIEAGLATDGGLFLPRSIPQVPSGTLDGTSFVSMAKGVLQNWLGDTEFEESWGDIVSDALSFPVPVVPVQDDVFVCELFHGPTLSFKDFGARTMARLLGDRLGRTGQERIILVATSGDTGSAVADGFAGIPGIQVVLLYPGGGVSEVQERQLITRRPGVHPFRIQGSFDDCQRLVKAAFTHDAWQGLPLSTANSINIGRLLPQMLYYWWGVLNMVEASESGEVPSICVPSGNLGNLTAGIMAHLSGMPVAGFHAAHNANDFFFRFMSDPSSAFGVTVKTVSNAMDVGAPSNFERLRTLLPGSSLSERISVSSTTDEQTLATMQRVYQQTEYVADPHTAVGIRAVEEARQVGRMQGPVLVMSTAHPAKFPDTCQKATGVAPDEPDALARLKEAPKDWTDLDPDIAGLADIVRQKTGL